MHSGSKISSPILAHSRSNSNFLFKTILTYNTTCGGVVYMATLRGIIANEIYGTDLYTIRINIDERKSVLYAIDTENCDEDEIALVDKKGKIKPEIMKMGNKTILTFDKKSDIYSIAYVKKDFIRNTDGFFIYNEKWGGSSDFFFYISFS